LEANTCSFYITVPLLWDRRCFSHRSGTEEGDLQYCTYNTYQNQEIYLKTNAESIESSNKLLIESSNNILEFQNLIRIPILIGSGNIYWRIPSLLNWEDGDQSTSNRKKAFCTRSCMRLPGKNYFRPPVKNDISIFAYSQKIILIVLRYQYSTYNRQSVIPGDMTAFGAKTTVLKIWESENVGKCRNRYLHIHSLG
jgi:hypothetical protein